MHFPVIVFFSRALRIDSRSVLTYVMRMFLAGVMILMLSYATLMQFTQTAPGRGYFTALVFLNLVFISAVGLAFFATSITEEKEELTLGLLKMSGLNPASILLGKSTSRLIGTVMLLLVQVPFAVLAVTLGGVSINQVWAAYAAIGAYIIMLANMGLFCSVLCDKGRQAAVLTAVLLGLFLSLPGLIKVLLSPLVDLGKMETTDPLYLLLSAVADSLLRTSPFLRLAEIMKTGFSGGPADYQVWASLIWGCTFFLLAWLTFNRRTREQKTAAPSRGFLPTRIPLIKSLGAGRAWTNALLWKEFHFTTGGKPKILLKTFSFLGLLVGLAAIFYTAARWNTNLDPDLDEIREVAGVTTFFIVLGISALELALYASRMFAQEIKWKTFSSLVTLPYTMFQLMRAKILGCLLAIIPNLVILVLCFLVTPDAFVDVVAEIIDEPEALSVCTYIFLQYVFFIYLAALLSLFVKWGAFPLAFVIIFVWQQVIWTTFAVFAMGMTAFSGEPFIFMWLLSGATIGVIVLVHIIIQQRLCRLAGQAA